MHFVFYVILFLIGAILFKFLNLNEGLSISGWVRYYFINKDRTIDPKLCDTEPLDNYDPLTPATQPDNDNENILIIHGPGRIPAGRARITEEGIPFDEYIGDILSTHSDISELTVIDTGIGVPLTLEEEQETEEKKFWGCPTESINPSQLRRVGGSERLDRPVNTISNLKNVLLLTFYTPNGINHNSLFQLHMNGSIYPDTFRMAYIDNDGNYIGKDSSGCNTEYNVQELLESAIEWYGQQRVDYLSGTGVDGYITDTTFSRRFEDLTLGNMKSFTFGRTSILDRLFNVGRGVSTRKCLEFIEYVRSELLLAGVNQMNFNLTVHIYYDTAPIVAWREAIGIEYVPANFLQYTFHATNLNELLNNLFALNILFNHDDVTYTDNPLDDSCASRGPDPGGAE